MTQPSPSPESSFGGADNEDTVGNAARLEDAGPPSFATFNRAVTAAKVSAAAASTPSVLTGTSNAQRVTMTQVIYPWLPPTVSKTPRATAAAGGGAAPALAFDKFQQQLLGKALPPQRTITEADMKAVMAWEEKQAHREFVHACAAAGAPPSPATDDALVSATKTLIATADSGLCYHLAGLETNIRVLQDNLPKAEAKQRICELFDKVRYLVAPCLRQLGVSDRQMEDMGIVDVRHQLAPFFGLAPMRSSLQ